MCSVLIFDTSNEPCTEKTLSEVLEPAYWYHIAAPWTITIYKPIHVKADSCSTTCQIGSSNPSNHAWFTDEGDRFVIESFDMSLVSGQDSLDVTDISITTNSPGSCSDSFNPMISMRNPCQALWQGVSTVITNPTMVDQTINLDDPNPVIYNVGHFADSVSDAHSDPYLCGVR